jgi:hypothetical protein
VPKPIKGTPDGLLTIDSWGEALAERINEAANWKEFTAYRVADASRLFTVTIALTRLHEAWIDDVSVEPIARRDAAGRNGGAPDSPLATCSLPLFRHEPGEKRLDDVGGTDGHRPKDGRLGRAAQQPKRRLSAPRQQAVMATQGCLPRL